MKKQTGRSMIEMLAVLAIVGVLSIAALVGFTFAMNKHRANETIYDVMLRATNVPMMDEYYAGKPLGYEFTFSGLAGDGTQGTYYAMHTYKDGGSAYRVEVLDVTDHVCEQILRMHPTDVDEIIVGTTSFTGDEDICVANTNKMTFCFGLSDGSGTCNPDSGSGSGSGSGNTPEDPCADKECGTGATCVDGTCVSCTDGSACNCASGTWNATANLCCEEVTEPIENVCYTYAFQPAANGQCPTYTFTYLAALCGTNGYCAEGTCIECNEGETATEAGCEAIQCEITEDNIASVTNEYCCTNFGGVWENEACACPEGYIFDTETDQCVVSDGQCSYNYNNPNSVKVKYADCAYANNTPTGAQESYADCIYSNAQPTDRQNLSMTVQRACPAGKYCYLKWATDDCSSTVGASGSTPIYGRCLPLDSVDAYCKKRYSGTLNISPTKQCPTGQYCYLNWSTENCSSTLSSAGSNPLYGRCLPLDSSTASCRSTYSESLKLDPIQSCPSGKYCYLKWAEENCVSSVDSSGADPFYGVCLDLNSVNAVCP